MYPHAAARGRHFRNGAGAGFVGLGWNFVNFGWRGGLLGWPQAAFALSELAGGGLECTFRPLVGFFGWLMGRERVGAIT